MSDAPPPFYEDELSLAALLTAVPCARVFVRWDLRAWGVDHDAIEPAELLVSELVTNAVKATGVIEPRLPYSHVYDGLRLISIQLRLFSDRLVIGVWDSSPQPPVLQMPALDAEDGRGLLLVASMSSRWGYYHPRRGGKVVWCELLVKSALDDTSGLPHTLPKRKHGGRKSTEVMSDPQILQWVLDRLRQLGQ